MLIGNTIFQNDAGHGGGLYLNHSNATMSNNLVADNNTSGSGSGLYVDDSNHPEDYQGLFFFSDPGGSDPADSAFPYARCQKLTVRGLTTASEIQPRISTNSQVEDSVELVEEPVASDVRIPPKPDFLP